MPQLSQHLELDRCPHCSVDCPSLIAITQFQTNNHKNNCLRYWRIYSCQRCGGVVSAYASNLEYPVQKFFPSSIEVEDTIPDKAKEYLKQALNSLHSPAGAVMLSASSVDAMLKSKGYKEGSLYTRIDQAIKDNLITKEMGLWAHEVRLDANDQRHADQEAPIPESEHAKRSTEFALALGQFLFVLPARVQKGLNEAKKKAKYS